MQRNLLFPMQMPFLYLPLEHTKMGSIYSYSYWERLSTDAYTQAPTSTPQPAEFDSDSIYLPGDLVVYNNSLYYM